MYSYTFTSQHSSVKQHKGAKKDYVIFPPSFILERISYVF